MKTGDNTDLEAFLRGSVQYEADVVVGTGVVFAGDGIRVRSGAILEPASIIGKGVTIGLGARVRTGAVVLQSVPANAIVEGNPARVVGYTRDIVRNGVEAIEFGQYDLDLEKRPKKIALGVNGCEAYLMRKFSDARGSLSVGEIPDDLPFLPNRFFTVFGVPSEELRGEHAHKECQQFLICMSGSCRVLLDDGENRREVILDRPDVGVFMPEMVWGTQYKYTPDAVLLVFASHVYNADDYLRTYDDFLRELVF